MSTVYLCDRCQKQIPIGVATWEVSAKPKNPHPMSQHVTTKSFDLCATCMSAMDRFMEGFAVGDGRERK